MSPSNRTTTYAAGIIERADNHILIATSGGSDRPSRQWLFPRGPVEVAESPEAAMRRIAKDDLGLTVEIVVGQPPIVRRLDGEEVELRYFFCGVSAGHARRGPYAVIRWVPRAHLREYAFDPASEPVVTWLLEQKGP